MASYPCPVQRNESPEDATRPTFCPLRGPRLGQSAFARTLVRAPALAGGRSREMRRYRAMSAENTKRTSQPRAEGSAPMRSRTVRTPAAVSSVISAAKAGIDADTRTCGERSTRRFAVRRRPRCIDERYPDVVRRLVDDVQPAVRLRSCRPKSRRMPQHGRERRRMTRRSSARRVRRGKRNHPHATRIHVSAHGDGRNVVTPDQVAYRVDEVAAPARGFERKVAAGAPAGACFARAVAAARRRLTARRLAASRAVSRPARRGRRRIVRSHDGAMTNLARATYREDRGKNPPKRRPNNRHAPSYGGVVSRLKSAISAIW